MPDEPTPPGRRGLGRDFALLLSGFSASNLGDGLLRSAGPLLVTTLTRQPSLVALAVTIQFVPTLLFSLPFGAMVDRRDRRRLQAAGNAVRAVVAAGVAAALVADVLTLPLLYAALFALGTAEVAADTAGQTLVVDVVDDVDLGRATSRMVAARTTANNLAGPPVGALLLGVGLAVPYAATALLMLAGAVLVLRIRPSRREDPPGDERDVVPTVRAQIVEGWRHVVDTPPVRRLAVLIVAFNVTFGTFVGIQVLWALERLGLDETGFGVLLTASAVGALGGAVVFPRLERRFRYATLLRVGLLVETAVHFAFAWTTSALVAGAVLVLFGVHEAVWGSLAGTIRARIVPGRLLGRVNAVYRLAVFAPLVVGSTLGGLLADRVGIPATLVVSGVGSLLATAWAWRRMDDLGAAADLPEPRTPPERAPVGSDG